MPWGAQLVLGLGGLAVYVVQSYWHYRLASKALDRALRPGVPDVVRALVSEPGSGRPSESSRRPDAV
jgi:hypothetical protein